MEEDAAYTGKVIAICVGEQEEADIIPDVFEEAEENEVDMRVVSC